MLLSLLLAAAAPAAPAALVPAQAASAPRSTDRLPPANPLPIADDDSAAVLAPVRALLAGIAARDPAAVLAQVAPEGGATRVDEAGVHRQNWADFAAGVANGAAGLAERLTDPAVESDGQVAMVWSPYVRSVAGQVRQCGSYHADLVRVGGAWRVLDLSWSQTARGCAA